MSARLVSPGFDPFWCGDHGIAPWIELYGWNILGRYRLHGTDLVTDASALVSPNDFSADPPWSHPRTTSPDAHTIKEEAITGAHGIFQSLAGITAVGPIGFQIDLEADGRDYARTDVYAGGGGLYYSAVVRLTDGALINSANCTPTVTALGGGIYRINIPDAMIDDPATALVRTNMSPDGTTFGYAGDITKGIKAYNATIDQDSILTAPNDPTLAARNLALYGDPYHYTNPNKASQLVVGADVWDGLPGAIASGASWIACDEMATRYAGEDKQIFVAVSVQSATLGASDYIVGLGNSADNNPHQALGTGAGPNWGAVKDDNISSGPVTNTSATACDGDRHILAWSHDGTKETIWLDGVVTSISAAASDLGAMTVDQVTLFALRKIAAANHAPVIARDVIVGMAASPAQMRAAYSLMRAENPI